MSAEDVNPILDEAYESLNDVLEHRRDIDSDLAEELERTRDTIDDVRGRVNQLEDRNEEYQDALDTVLTDFEDMAQTEIDEREQLYEELRDFRQDLEDIAEDDDSYDYEGGSHDAADELESQRNRDPDYYDVDTSHIENSETDRRGFAKWIFLLLTGGTLLGAGAVGKELLEENEDSNGGSSQPPAATDTPTETPEPTETPTEEPEQTPEPTPEPENQYDFSELAAETVLSDRSYEALEADFEDIGDIIEEYKDISGLSQFGNDLQEAWGENSASSLSLGLTSVKVVEGNQGTRLVYEDDDPDAYIGQLWDYDDDILESGVFSDEEAYEEALEVMEEYD